MQVEELSWVVFYGKDDDALCGCYMRHADAAREAKQYAGESSITPVELDAGAVRILGKEMARKCLVADVNRFGLPPGRWE